MSKIYHKWTKEEIEYVRNLRDAGLEFKKITERYNKKFSQKLSHNSVKSAYNTYDGIDLDSQNNLLDTIKTLQRSKEATKKLRKDLVDISTEANAQEDFIEQVENIISNIKFKIHPKSKTVSTGKSSKSKRTIVMHLSDTHFGSNIESDDLGELNSYTNIEEARRLAFFTREVANFKKQHRKNTDLVIAMNGDLLQGVIHNIDATVPLATQFSAAIHLMVQSISYLANEFNSIQVICLTDNHGRAMHRPEKGRHTQNRWDGYTTMFHVALKGALKMYKNVSFTIPQTPYFYGKIRGHNYLILHSDSVLSTGSVGKTVSVDVIKNRINDLVSGIGPMDVVMCGHTHVDLKTTLKNGVTLLCNGCMSGIDEYALSLGITKNLPSQQLFEVTDKYAVGDFRTIDLTGADKDKALDKIIEPFTGKF